MKILITGANGFIGSLLKERFSSTSWAVHDFVGDILNIDDLKKYFYPGCSWDFVIHLAGMSSVPQCADAPAEAYRVNSVGTFMIVDFIKEFSPQSKLIFSSTGQVYNLSADLTKPVDETHQVRPGNVYAKTKRAAELYINDAFQMFDGSYVILRMFNHSHKSQRPDFFMPSIFQQIMEKKNRGEPVVLDVGNIEIERDIGAVQDLAEAFYRIVLSNKKIRQTYNLCSGVGKSLKRIVEEMSVALEIPVTLQIIQERIRKDDPIKMIASCSRLSTEFDWHPEHAASEKQLVQSFLSEVVSSKS